MLNVINIRHKTFRGQTFSFGEVQGYGGYDHASHWTFDDEDSVRDRWWKPAKGDTVLDIGAAFGGYALPALACGARVVCFSPADLDNEILQNNLSLNPELEQRCLVVRDGLYSRNGWFDPDHCKFSETEIGQPWLRVRTLDSFLDERPGIERVDWMKLDVEGAELEVLAGARKCIQMYKPKILVENHEQHVPGVSDHVRGFLSGLGLGYRCDGPYPYGVVSHSFYEVT